MKNTNAQFILFMIFIIVSQLIFGCTSQKVLNWKVRNAERYAHRKGLVIQDTLNVTVRDTIYINSVQFDTTLKIVHHDTTMIVNNERMRAVYFYDTLRQEFWFEQECKDSTIYIEKTVRVPVDKIKKTEGGLRWWQGLIILAVILIIVFIGMRV